MDLRINKITNINILEKVNFKELKMVNLSFNLISDIKVIVKFEKLTFLDISFNEINKEENASIINNLKMTIKHFIFD